VAFTGCLTNSSTTRAVAAGSTEAVKHSGAVVSEVTATAGRYNFRLSFDVASIIYLATLSFTVSTLVA
jgi:hypothetical protein